MTPGWKHRLRLLHRKAERKLYRMLGRYNSRLQPHKLFSIKAGYRHATSVDTTADKDELLRSVYELANGKLTNLSTLDVDYDFVHKLDETDPKTLQTDLIICSNVIGQMADPDELLDFVGRYPF